MIIYTDGSSNYRTREGGWSFVVIHDDLQTEVGGYATDTTNNRMELKAAIEALKYACYRWPGEEITLCSDSEYLVKGITQWIHKWKRNKFRSESKSDHHAQILNKDLWKELDQRRTGVNVDFKWVKGHANDVWNNLCDDIAGRCCEKREGHYKEHKVTVNVPRFVPNALIDAMLAM